MMSNIDRNRSCLKTKVLIFSMTIFFHGLSWCVFSILKPPTNYLVFFDVAFPHALSVLIYYGGIIISRRFLRATIFSKIELD